MGTCGKCIHKKTVATDYPCAVCDCVTYYEEARPQTNADRIRAMSDEELAEWLDEHCYQYGWANWLKQEVDNED